MSCFRAHVCSFSFIQFSGENVSESNEHFYLFFCPQFLSVVSSFSPPAEFFHFAAESLFVKLRNLKETHSSFDSAKSETR